MEGSLELGGRVAGCLESVRRIEGQTLPPVRAHRNTFNELVTRSRRAGGRPAILFSAYL
jgi:hypothetical protein